MSAGLARRTVAVAADDDQGLVGEVSAHFGRCPFYLLVEVEDGVPRVGRTVPNPYYDAHQPGVIPGFIQSLGADVIVAGGMGPRAIALFDQYGVEVVTGGVGRVGAVLQAWLDGRLAGRAPCAHDHPSSCGGGH